MNDHSLNLPLTALAAATCGLIAIALIVANFFLESDDLGFASMPFLAGAIVLRVRTWFCLMSERERDAYLLGRESGRASVRSVH